MDISQAKYLELSGESSYELELKGEQGRGGESWRRRHAQCAKPQCKQVANLPVFLFCFFLTTVYMYDLPNPWEKCQKYMLFDIEPDATKVSFISPL